LKKTDTNSKQVRIEFFDPFFNNIESKISNIRRCAKNPILARSVVDLVMVEEVWNVEDQRRKEAKRQKL
jgi:hypothetical protein